MEQKPTQRIFEIPEEVLVNLLRFLAQLPYNQSNPHIRAIEQTAKEKEPEIAEKVQEQKKLVKTDKPVVDAKEE